MYLSAWFRLRSSANPESRAPRRGPRRAHGPAVHRRAASPSPFLEVLEARTLLDAQILTINRFVPHISTVPVIFGQHIHLFVREKVQEQLAGHAPVVLFAHGGTVGALPAFDLQFKDYSFMDYLAKAGFDVFAMDFTGYGQSPRPTMDDPCNASLADQRALLIPNPLSETCLPSYPFRLTDSQTDRDDMDAVVDYLRVLRRVDRVSLIGTSEGGLRAGSYAAQHPEKVDKMVLYSPVYFRDLPSDRPAVYPIPGVPMMLWTRSLLEQTFDPQVHYEGQVEPGLRDAEWQAIQDRDPLGRTWGPAGVSRGPSGGPAGAWGWNQVFAGRVQDPTLVIGGEFDTLANPEQVRQLYEDLGTDNKVVVELAGTGHQINFEWQHTVLQSAALDWLRDGSIQGVQQGLFWVDIQHHFHHLQTPATVSSVAINDGSAQRSMVNSLTVSFSGIVTMAPAAIQLRQQEGGQIKVQVATAVVGDQTVAVVTFTGPNIIGGSLADGHYTMTIRGGLVHDPFNVALDGAGNARPGSNRVDTFFRLFGDSNGDGHVDLQDLLGFMSTFGKHAGDPGYLSYFDYYGAGSVDLGDLLQFLLRFGA